MPTIEQRMKAMKDWRPAGLAAHCELDVMPLYRKALAAAENHDETVNIGLRNHKRSKTVKLAIGVRGPVNPDGYGCTVNTADLLAACEDELAAIHALLSTAAQHSATAV